MNTSYKNHGAALYSTVKLLFQSGDEPSAFLW